MARFLCVDARSAPGRRKRVFFAGAGRLAKGFSASQFPALATFVCRASEIGSRGALVLARAVVSKASSLKSLELGATVYLTRRWPSSLPLCLLMWSGKMEDNDEDLCDEDELDRLAGDWTGGPAVAGVAVAYCGGGHDNGA